MNREVITCPNVAPAGPYSHAIKAGGMLYVSGNLGLHPELRTIVPGGVGAQTRMALDNLRHVLESGGSSLDRVVKCTCLLADMSYFPEFNAIYMEYFPTNPPARTTFAVLGLPLGGLVEVDAIAIAE